MGFLSPDFFKNAAFNALFRKGGRTKELDLGMTLKEFEARDKELSHEGFRLTFLYQWTEDGDDSYQAAWEPGEGAQHWLLTDSGLDLFEAIDKHFHKGLRLKYLRANDGRFTAIFRPGEGEQFWLANVTFSEFKAKDEEMRAKGFCLMRMCDDHGLYSAFWQPGTSNNNWVSEGDSDIAKDKFNTFIALEEKKGKRAVSMGGEKFCAVVHPGSEDQEIVIFKPQHPFDKKCEELFKEGFQILDLFITEFDSIDNPEKD